MKTTAFEKREDGSFIFNNPHIVESDNIPEGLFLPDATKFYNDQGYEITRPEPSPLEKSIEEKVEEHVNKIVTLEETINVIYGGV